MPKHIDSHKHTADKRAHIPSKEEAGYEEANAKVQEGKKVLELSKNPVAHRGQDPELFWLNKYGNDDRDELLKVDIRSLYRHEHIAPETLIKNLYKVTETQSNQMDLFSVNELFGNALEKDEIEKVSEYYHHQDGWTNRLIQGDSHLVMASLLEREGMAGQVQTIFLDPPYGIKYGGNWQIKLNNRDVKDGSDEALTSEPEQIKAFRDTWELGIHSYLSYLRDRLLIAKELLNESGSCFLQIGDENVHLVRSVMDEVFGSENFCSQIIFKTTAGKGSSRLDRIYDCILWYGKEIEKTKYRPLFEERNEDEDETRYSYIELKNGEFRRLSKEELSGQVSSPEGKRFRITALNSQGQTGGETSLPFEWNGNTYHPPKGRHWSVMHEGLKNLSKRNRLILEGKNLCYKRFLEDYPVSEVKNIWMDAGGGALVHEKAYVVQTTTKVIQRCLLMTTDPGDLVLDPTCVRAGTKVWAISPLNAGGEETIPPQSEKEEAIPPLPPEEGQDAFGILETNLLQQIPPKSEKEEVTPPLPLEEGQDAFGILETNLLQQIPPFGGQGGINTFDGQGGTTLLPIESLRPGDTVLSHDGKPHTILRTIQKTYTGKMIGIQHSHSDTQLWLTEDHKVLCKKRSSSHKEARYMQNVYSPNFDRAKKMRKEKTLPEKLLWDRIRANQLGVTFRQQRTIGKYIVDFFAIENDLIIEIDGDQHNDIQAQIYDKERDAFFAKIGLETWRIPAKRVIHEFENVLEELKQKLQSVQKSDIKDIDWRIAGTLQKGDTLYFPQGNKGALIEVNITELLSAETSETVYDLEVEGAHSFLTEVCAVHNCGSGTTAYVAEQWGRRWITIDTSRIALNIAKQRLMTATFPYYKMYDEKGGDIRQGFIYKTVPHITLKSLANDEPPATETLYDQPEQDKKRLRVSGPFTVETLQNFEPISPEALDDEVRVNEQAGAFEEVIKQHLISAGIKNGRKDEMVVFRSVELLSHSYLHAEGFYVNEGGENKAYIHIGPKFGTVSKTAVNESVKECRIRGDANWLIILGFSFESDIEGSTQTMSMGKFEVTKVRIHDDLLQEGLKKKPAKSAASFVTIGEPDIDIIKNGKEVSIEIKGLDIYDPIRDEVKARNIHDIAYWMVDDDYDGSNFVVKQVFFCGGDKSEFDKWKKGLDNLAKDNTKKKVEKTLKIEIDDDAFDRLYGHISHPIEIKKKGQKIAVRIISQFGEECMKVLVME